MLYSVDFCYHGYRNVIYLTELTSVKIIYNKEKNYRAMIYENNYFNKIFFFKYNKYDTKSPVQNGQSKIKCLDVQFSRHIQV